MFNARRAPWISTNIICLSTGPIFKSKVPTTVKLYVVNALSIVVPTNVTTSPNEISNCLASLALTRDSLKCRISLPDTIRVSNSHNSACLEFSDKKSMPVAKTGP